MKVGVWMIGAHVQGPWAPHPDEACAGETGGNALFQTELSGSLPWPSLSPSSA